MIILDIETSGLNPQRHCMLSLGAIDFDTGKEFYGECSLYPDSEVQPEALEINGFKLIDIQPGRKPPAHHLYDDFKIWAREFPDKMIAGQNVGHLDTPFLEYLHETYYPSNDKWPFGYRTFDLHSAAFQLFGMSLNHRELCAKLGLEGEPKPHHALYGARSERDCFRELKRLRGDLQIAIKGLMQDYRSEGCPDPTCAVCRKSKAAESAALRIIEEINSPKPDLYSHA